MFQVTHFFFREKTVFTAIHIFLGQPRIGYPVQVPDIISQRLENATNDTVTATMNFDANLCLVFYIGKYLIL